MATKPTPKHELVLQLDMLGTSITFWFATEDAAAFVSQEAPAYGAYADTIIGDARLEVAPLWDVMEVAQYLAGDNGKIIDRRMFNISDESE